MRVESPKPPSTGVFLGGYAAKQCHTRTGNDYSPDLGPDDQDPIDPFTQAILDSGNQYEDPVVKNQLMKAMRQSVTIDTTKKLSGEAMLNALDEARQVRLVLFIGDRSPRSLSVRETLTHALANNPGKVRVLWNPRLRRWKRDERGKVVWGDRAAEPDILYRQRSRSSQPRWSSIDVKFHNPFSGEQHGRSWKMSSLRAPYPERATLIPWIGVMRREDAYQLAHYHRTLEFHGLAGQPIAGIIGKPLDDETRVLWLNLTDAIYDRNTQSALSMYDTSFEKVLAVAKREVERRTNPHLESLAPPSWKAECKTCPWHSHCHDELSIADDISLLAGVTQSKIVDHHAAGVSTVSQLARLDVPTAALVEMGIPHLEDLINEAGVTNAPVSDLLATVAPELGSRKAANVVAKLAEAGYADGASLARLHAPTARYRAGVTGLIRNIDQARVVDYVHVRRTDEVFRARGIEELDVPQTPVEIHVDMENDEHIYLWGMYTVWRYKGSKVRRDYRAFVSWSATDEGEATAFAEFWAALTSMLDKAREAGTPALVFHYTAAEDRCMKHLADKHAGFPGMPARAEIDEFVDSATWVDLYPLVNNQLVWSTEDATLKSLAKHIRFEWRDDDPSGSNSVVWYQRATSDDPDNETWRTRILKYNEDDVKATAAVLEWLTRVGAADSPGRKVRPVESLDLRYQRRR